MGSNRVYVILATMLSCLAVALAKKARDGNSNALQDASSKARKVKSNGGAAFQQRFRQKLDTLEFDLGMTELRFIPGEDAPCVTSIGDFPYSTQGTSLQLDDNNFVEVQFTAGSTFTFFGQTYASVFIGSNGYITFGNGDSSSELKSSNFNSLPRVAALMTDLVPVQGSTIITYSQDEDMLVLTVQKIRHASDSDSFASYQIALHFGDGSSTITHTDTTLKRQSIKAIVGLSSGIKGDKVKVNFDESATCSEADQPGPDVATGECVSSRSAAVDSAKSKKTRGMGKIPGVDIINRSTEETRIIGGEDAEKGRYPYLVFVQGCGDRGCFSCGGSLIAPNVVLSAAHCNAESHTVFIGGNDLINDSFDSIAVVKAYEHPHYDPGSLENDVLVLELEADAAQQPVLMDRQGKEDGVHLPHTSNPEDRLLTVAGWGVTEQGSTSNTLKEVNVSYVSNPECGEAYGSSLIKGDMMCAAARGKDACQGDSGGPIFVRSEDGDPFNDVQVGIVSWGIGCANPSFPGVYSRVAKARKWIDATLATIGAVARC